MVKGKYAEIFGVEISKDKSGSTIIATIQGYGKNLHKDDIITVGKKDYRVIHINDDKTLLLKDAITAIKTYPVYIPKLAYKGIKGE